MYGLLRCVPYPAHALNQSSWRGCWRGAAPTGIRRGNYFIKLTGSCIDYGLRSSYSLAQIPDLVANANPRSHRTVVSYCSDVRRVSRSVRYEKSARHEDSRQGLKPVLNKAARAARLKSCPDASWLKRRNLLRFRNASPDPSALLEWDLFQFPNAIPDPRCAAKSDSLRPRTRESTRSIAQPTPEAALLRRSRAHASSQHTGGSRIH
jgi:hypothetical protein